MARRAFAGGTHRVEAGQNFPDIADIRYGDWRLYPRIVEANAAAFARRPPHRDDRWEHPITAPVLFAGDSVWVPPYQPEPAEPPPPATPPRGRVFAKSRWEGTGHQSPAPRLQIFFGSGSAEPDMTYSADPDAEAGRRKLLSYTFAEAVDDLEGSFTFSVEDDAPAGEKSAFDKIPLRGIVRIFEGDPDRPVFTGIIRRRKIKKSMTSQGVKRTAAFGGKSVISCIAEHSVSLDVRMQGVADPASRNKELTSRLAQGDLSVRRFMTETWEHFREVSQNPGVVATSALAAIIERFIGEGPGAFLKVQDGMTFRYNIAAVFYSAAANVLADVWRKMLPGRVYEMFSRSEPEGPRVIVRQVPFEPADWASLDAYEISPASLISYELSRSDEEVYTAFAAYIIGSAMSSDFYMAASQDGPDGTVQFDREKMALYGFRLLQIDFNGVDRQGNAGGRDRAALTDAVRDLSRKAKRWYSRLDEMHSGSVTVVTDFNEPQSNPRAGCRALFLGGELYIEKAEHSWSYGGTPTITLSVSRGMVYGGGGEMDEAMRDVGRKYRELEREA